MPGRHSSFSISESSWFAGVYACRYPFCQEHVWVVLSCDIHTSLCSGRSNSVVVFLFVLGLMALFLRTSPPIRISGCHFFFDPGFYIVALISWHVFHITQFLPILFDSFFGQMAAVDFLSVFFLLLLIFIPSPIKF